VPLGGKCRSGVDYVISSLSSTTTPDLHNPPFFILSTTLPRSTSPIMADSASVEPPQAAVVPPPYVFGTSLPATPLSSSSSSRSRKRPRSSINDDASIGTGASVAFTETVKRNVTQLQDTCWHCGATPVQVCHVIPKRDSSVRFQSPCPSLPTLSPLTTALILVFGA
jgi:hypothetical protein